MKYQFNKKIFYVNLIICVTIVLIVLFSQGIGLITKPTMTITCENFQKIPCKYRAENGSFAYLPYGETIVKNMYNQKYLDFANYGVWIMIIISLILNHLLFNRNYPLKHNIKKIIKKFIYRD